MYLSSFSSNEPLHPGRCCPALDAASEGFGGAAACPVPQRGSKCCRRAQLCCPYRPEPPLPVGPWQPQSSGSGNDWEGGGWFEASPPPPAGGLGKGMQQKERMGGEGPGLEDGGDPGSHNTGCMQGGIWDMQRGLQQKKTKKTPQTQTQTQTHAQETRDKYNKNDKHYSTKCQLICIHVWYIYIACGGNHVICVLDGL